MTEIIEHHEDPEGEDMGAVIDKMAPGQVGWFTDGPDDGPSGYFVKVDEHRMVCAQDLPRQTYAELDEDTRDALGDEHGLFVTIYDDSKPRGEQGQTVARVSMETAEFVALAIARGMIAGVQV